MKQLALNKQWEYAQRCENTVAVGVPVWSKYLPLKADSEGRYLSARTAKAWTAYYYRNKK